MRVRIFGGFVLALLSIFVFWGVAAGFAPGKGEALPQRVNVQSVQPFIVDHTTTDITAIPQSWIETAKNDLHIYYGHTSHGSQLMTGMSGLVGFANQGGLGLALPDDIFVGLDVVETSPDAGYYPEWVNNTRAYLGTPDPATGRGTSHPQTNVVIWSWCGQVSSITAEDLNAHYLEPMSQLEADYPGIAFVYMTGHSDGTGETGNLHLRNQQIRQYAIQNGKILYDFYDIELYDPDGSYFGDKLVNDNCDYDSDGNGSRDHNWAIDWQNEHVENQDWYSCSCAHSQALNCNQKAYAAWWMWARLAGWNGPGESRKSASAVIAVPAQVVTYTVTIQNLAAPITATLSMTDTIPSGLSYLGGSLEATSGVWDDSQQPALTWTGELNSTPLVTITYAVTVTAGSPELIVNTATITADGYEVIKRSHTLAVNPFIIYLPLLPRGKSAP
jgi:uncharacterized repeat protein (TIGR01451 family)